MSFILAMLATIMTILPAKAQSNSIIGSWSGTYVCELGATQAELEVISPSRGRFIFAVPNGPPGAFIVEITAGPGGRLELKPQEWVRRPERYSPIEMTLSLNSSGRLTGQVNNNPACGAVVLERGSSLAARAGLPVLSPKLHQAGTPASQAPAPRSQAASLPLVDVGPCLGELGCHFLVGSWRGRQTCAGLETDFQLDVPVEGNVQPIKQDIFYVGPLKATLHVMERNSGLRGSIGLSGDTNRDIKMVPDGRNSGEVRFNVGAFNGSFTDGTPGHLTLHVAKDSCNFVTVTRMTPHVPRERTMALRRAEAELLTSDWRGMMRCAGRWQPVTFKREASGTHIQFAVGQHSLQFRVAPERMIDHNFTTDQPILEAADATGNGLSFRPFIGINKPDYIEFTMSLAAGGSLTAACGPRTTGILSRFVPAPSAGGEYASATSLLARCDVVGRWLDIVPSELEAVDRLKTSYPLAFARTDFAPGLALALLEPTRFTRYFGVSAAQAMGDAVLMRQIRDCAFHDVRNDQIAVRLQASLFTDRDGGSPVRLQRSMNVNSPFKWLPGIPGNLRDDLANIVVNAGRMDEAVEGFKAQFSAWMSEDGRNFDSYIASRPVFAARLAPSVLLGLLEQASPAARDRVRAVADSNRDARLSACRRAGGPGHVEPESAQIAEAVQNRMMLNCERGQNLWVGLSGNAGNADTVQRLSFAQMSREGGICRVNALMWVGQVRINSAVKSSCSRLSSSSFECDATVTMSCQVSAVPAFDGDRRMIETACAAFQAPARTRLTVRQDDECAWIVSDK